MSSINPNNIDGTYPIAGQDNDSQGFRDNFTNIKNNFTFSKTEIEDLQNNAILKTALAGTTLDNNLNNAQLYGAQIRKFTETREDLGTQVGSVPISWNDAHFQTLAITGNTTISLSGWPTSGFWTYLVLDVTPSTDNLGLTLPAAVSVNTSNIQGSSGNTITLAKGNVTYRFEFSTYDGGSIVAVRDLFRNYDSPIDFTTLNATTVNATGNVLASSIITAGLTSNGNTTVGKSGVAGGQFHSIVGNITQTSSGGAVYINTTGNVLASAVSAATGTFVNLTTTGATVQSGYQFYQPSANVFIQANVGISRVILAPISSALVSFSANVTLPNTTVDGTVVSISSNSAVQFFSVMAPYPDSGRQITPQGNVALAAGGKAEYLYRSADNTWYKVG